MIVGGQTGFWKRKANDVNHKRTATDPFFIIYDISDRPMPRAFISLMTGKACDFPKAPQRLKAFRTALSVKRFGLTFCSAICFRRSCETQTQDWRRCRNCKRLVEDVKTTNQYQLPFLIVFLLDFRSGCDQGIEDVHVSWRRKQKRTQLWKTFRRHHQTWCDASARKRDDWKHAHPSGGCLAGQCRCWTLWSTRHTVNASTWW